MSRNLLYEDVLPFTAMVAVECAFVSKNTLFKAATAKGMSYFVFTVYSSAIATLVLLPLSFIFLRTTRTRLPPLKLPLLYRILAVAILGALAQIVGYKGIEYSSPTLAAAISNLTPAFTFILAIIFRMEKLTLRSWSTLAKITGTVLSILGALVVVMYKGPEVLLSSSARLNWSLSSSQENWVLGGTLIALEYLLIAVWFILQAQIMKMYPVEVVVVFFYNLLATIILALLSLIVENKPNAWKIQPDIELISIVYSGFVGSCFGILVHTWGLHLKGPLYISMFKPFSIVIAVAMGIIFLGDIIYLGSAIGAVIISIGFYAVIWGKAKEEVIKEEVIGSLESLPDKKTPLLV